MVYGTVPPSPVSTNTLLPARDLLRPDNNFDLATLPRLDADRPDGVFIPYQRPPSPSDYRQALADALRSVAAAGDALVALAEALEQHPAAPGPPGGHRVPQSNPLNGQPAPHLNGNGHLAREVRHG